MLKTTFAAAAALFLLCACSSHTHTISTSDGTVTVESTDKEKTALHVTGKDGSSVEINTGKQIKDYPGDVPLYEGKSVMDMKAGSKNARVVALETPDPMPKIVDFYRSQLGSKGWKVESTMSTDQMTMYVATKDSRKMVVTISSNGKTVTISQELADK